MTCKCGSGTRCLCPVSFGLALGITSALAVFIWSLWVIYHGVSPEMARYIPASMMTLQGSLINALLGFVKGFVFGFVLILFYDLFACYCKAKCCRRTDEEGGCTCCMPDKTEVKKRIKGKF